METSKETLNTAQIFKKVSGHLLKQNSRSVINYNKPGSYAATVCAYRGEGNKMCAVGCLINDEFYNLSLENKKVDSPEVMRALYKSGVECSPANISVLLALQDIHDRICIENWRWDLGTLAHGLGLEAPELNYVN